VYVHTVRVDARESAKGFSTNEYRNQAITEAVNYVIEDTKKFNYAITLPWSNRITEGTINKLKNIKRMMYGRAGITVLLIRLRFSV
jgi:transposase